MLTDPRSKALAGEHFDPVEAAQMFATVYVGDQLARSYDEDELSNQHRLDVVRNNALIQQNEALASQAEVLLFIAKQLGRIADAMERDPAC